jgi:hypothetical protein
MAYSPTKLLSNHSVVRSVYGFSEMRFMPQHPLRTRFRRRAPRSRKLNFSPAGFLALLPELKLRSAYPTKLPNPQLSAILGRRSLQKYHLDAYLTPGYSSRVPLERPVALPISSNRLDLSSQPSGLIGLRLPRFRLINLRLAPAAATRNSVRPTRLKVYPSYSPDFVRSPFFFFRLFSLRRPHVTDLVSAKKPLYRYFKCLVFPNGNDIKIAIFRRLNKQKLLAQSRIFSLNARSHLRSRYKFRTNRIRKSLHA